ncbi:hypothetical protein [Tateyamaria sp. syn59]|uniref:hypothetical protein n=1 Tax=Tateyamaria sp. syn59 TaxID=2576942 RepID=UPI001672FA1D|nr:hypothetical protein [Tateyamaria sp. syn59]
MSQNGHFCTIFALSILVRIKNQRFWLFANLQCAPDTPAQVNAVWVKRIGSKEM